MKCIGRRGNLLGPRLWRLIGVTLVALLIFGFFTKEISAQPARGARTLGPGQLVALDFDNADIRVVIKQISELIGRNFLVDEKVRGKVTIITPRKIRIRDVYRVFLGVMIVTWACAGATLYSKLTALPSRAGMSCRRR